MTEMTRPQLVGTAVVSCGPAPQRSRMIAFAPRESWAVLRAEVGSIVQFWTVVAHTPEWLAVAGLGTGARAVPAMTA
jgi:hypothetical protein